MSIIKRNYKFIYQNMFLKNVLFLSGGTIIAQFLVFLFSPIISRIYSAEDFGLFQQYQAILSFLLVISGLRYEMAVLMPKKKEEAYLLLLLSIIINISFSVLLFLFILILSFYGYTFSSLKGMINLIYFIPFAILGASLYQSLNNMVIREKEFKSIGTTKIIQSTGLVFGQVFTGSYLNISFGLLWGDLLSKFLGISTFIRVLFKKKEYKLNFNWSEIKSLAYKYRKFPKMSVPSGLLNVASLTISTFLIGNYFGLAILGYYALVDRIFAAPSMLIGQSISQVYMGDFIEMSHNNPEDLLVRFKNLVKRTGLLAILPYCVAAFLAPYTFGLVFGSNWNEAGIYFALLAPMQFVSIIVWPLIPTLNLLERQNWQFLWDAFRLVLVVGVLSFAHYFNFSARMSIFSYGITMLITYMIHLLLSYIAIKIRIKEFKEFSKNGS